MTRSGFSWSTSFCSTRATASGSSAWSLSTRMARSAPIASPVRSCSCAVFSPIETSTTSVPLTFSFSRSPSSIAISSKGLITHLTLSVVIPTPSGAIFTTVSGSGTRLTVTRIFTLGVSLRAAAPRQARSLHSAASGSQSTPTPARAQPCASRRPRSKPRRLESSRPAFRTSGATSFSMRSLVSREAGAATARVPTTFRV